MMEPTRKAARLFGFVRIDSDHCRAMGWIWVKQWVDIVVARAGYLSSPSPELDISHRPWIGPLGPKIGPCRPGTDPPEPVNFTFIER